MFQSVIVPVDPSPRSARAVGTARTIADAVGCPVLLLTVTSPNSGRDSAWFEQFAEGLDGPAVQRLEVVRDDPVEAILEVEAERPSALLCMASGAHTGASEIVLGSVAAEVVRRAKYPLVVVGPNAAPLSSLATLLVCLDGSERAESAARTASVWASLLRAAVHLVRVAPPSTPADAHDASSDLQRMAKQLRDGLGVQASWDVLHAEAPGPELVRCARSLPASMIVLTAHGATGVVSRLMGSTAMRVVHDAPCPVLLVPR